MEKRTMGLYEIMPPPFSYPPGPPATSTYQALLPTPIPPAHGDAIPHCFKHVQGNVDINWRHHGAMIGKQGWKIADVSRITGTVIRFPHITPPDGSGEANSVGIAGTVDAVEHCFQVLMRCVPVDITLRLKTKKVEQLLNPYRDDIRMLKNRCGVHVVVFEDGEEISLRSVAGPDPMPGAFHSLRNLLGEDAVEEDVCCRVYQSGIFRSAIEQAVNSMAIRDDIGVRYSPDNTPPNDFYVEFSGEVNTVMVARKLLLDALPVYLTVQVPHGMNLREVPIDEYRGKVFFYDQPKIHDRYKSHIMMAAACDAAYLMAAARVTVRRVESFLRERQHRQAIHEIEMRFASSSMNHRQHSRAGFAPRQVGARPEDPTAFVPPLPLAPSSSFSSERPQRHRRQRLSGVSEQNGSFRRGGSPYYHPGHPRGQDPPPFWHNTPQSHWPRHRSSHYDDRRQQPNSSKYWHRSVSREPEMGSIYEEGHEDYREESHGHYFNYRPRPTGNLTSFGAVPRARSTSENLVRVGEAQVPPRQAARRFSEYQGFRSKPVFQAADVCGEATSKLPRAAPVGGADGEASRGESAAARNNASMFIISPSSSSSGSSYGAFSFPSLISGRGDEFLITRADSIRVRRNSFDRPFIFRPDAVEQREQVPLLGVRERNPRKVHWQDETTMVDYRRYSTSRSRRQWSYEEDPNNIHGDVYPRNYPTNPYSYLDESYFGVPYEYGAYGHGDGQYGMGQGAYTAPYDGPSWMGGGYSTPRKPQYRRNEWRRSTSRQKSRTDSSRSTGSCRRRRFDQEKKPAAESKEKVEKEVVEQQLENVDEEGWQKVEHKRNKRRSKGQPGAVGGGRETERSAEGVAVAVHGGGDGERREGDRNQRSRRNKDSEPKTEAKKVDNPGRDRGRRRMVFKRSNPQPERTSGSKSE